MSCLLFDTTYAVNDDSTITIIIIRDIVYEWAAAVESAADAVGVVGAADPGNTLVWPAGFWPNVRLLALGVISIFTKHSNRGTETKYVSYYYRAATRVIIGLFVSRKYVEISGISRLRPVFNVYIFHSPSGSFCSQNNSLFFAHNPDI